MMKLLKLSCGEEILGEVSRIWFMRTKIENPVKVFYTYDADKGTSMFMFPWMAASSQSVQTIRNSKIDSVSIPSKLALEIYSKMYDPKVEAEETVTTIEDKINEIESVIQRQLLETCSFSKKDIQ